MAAVTDLTASYQSGDEWILSWTAGSAGSWDVYVDGVLAMTVLVPQASVHLDDGATVDVVENGDTPAEAYPRRITLAWWTVTDAVSYRIEEYVGTTWTWRQTITDDGRGAFAWSSRVLEDETDHQFRITATDAAGNAGTAETLAFRMVRIPDVPAVSIVIDGGQEDPPGTFYAEATITAT